MKGVEGKADVGGMRYKEDHARLVKYLEELGLESREFTSSGPNDRIYHLRGENFVQAELVTKTLPYKLRDDEKNKYYYGLLA